MTMADADGGGQKQLLVGSDDFEVIRTQERPSSVGGSMHGPTGMKAPVVVRHRRTCLLYLPRLICFSTPVCREPAQL